MEVETVFRNALVHDGTGSPPFRGHVAVRDDRIQAVVRDGQAAHFQADKEVDLAGLALAPGFIDAHTHDDRAVIDNPDMLAKLSQGVTTVVAGNCGISLAPVTFNDDPPPPMNLLGGAGAYSFPSMAGYARALEAARPAVNVIALIGHSALRLAVMEDVTRSATVAEISAMRELLARCMDEGASGFSTGLFYAPNAAADPGEVAAVGSAAAERMGIHTTHMRDEGAHVMESLQESVSTARVARFPLLISHHKCTGESNWGRSRETLPFLKKASTTQPVHLDVYPYTAGSTVLTEEQALGCERIMISWSRQRPEASGRFLADLENEWDVNRAEAVAMLEPAGAVYFQMHEDDVQRILQFENAIIGSDGLPHDTHPHPRLWGTFPRVIGRYARELGLFSIGAAIRKMTGLSAAVFGLADRGIIAAGKAADLVVFDADRILDRATFDNPCAMAEGIRSVYVNGVLAFDGNAPCGRAGRLLKAQSQWH